MRSLICLLFFCNTVSAQSFYFDNDSAFISTVALPAKEPFDTSRPYLKATTSFIYLISDKDVFDNFGYDVGIKFREFNFTEFHILGTRQCRKCLRICNHGKGVQRCHRDACIMEWVWMKRNNKKAFNLIPSVSLPGHGEQKHRIIYDTSVTVAGDTARWYTTGQGDCFATFDYAVVADKFFPALILKEYYYSGGCRAGGFKPATIIFKQPSGVLYKSKRTIFMEKKKNKSE